MGRVTRLVVSKARTVRSSEDEEWIRSEYTLEAAIDSDEELPIAKAQLEGLIDGWLTPSAKPFEIFKPANIFPKELAELLNFEEDREYIIVKPRQYLGAENFAKIAAVVKQHGGQYISEGKNSRFRLPKTSAK